MQKNHINLPIDFAMREIKYRFTNRVSMLEARYAYRLFKSQSAQAVNYLLNKSNQWW